MAKKRPVYKPIQVCPKTKDNYNIFKLEVQGRHKKKYTESEFIEWLIWKARNKLNREQMETIFYLGYHQEHIQ